MERTVIKIPSVNSLIPTSIEAGPKLFPDHASKVCPLCQSEVRLFFINFNDKMLMCENTECEFPFGYEELQFVKEDNDLHAHAEVASASFKTKKHGTPTCSIMSDEVWSDIDKMENIYESEESQQFEQKSLDPKEFLCYSKASPTKPNDKKQMELQQNLDKLKQINIKMKEIKKPTTYIMNENYLKRLVDLKGNTSLLKPEEQLIIKKESTQRKQDAPTVKLEVTKSDNSIAAIKIDFADEPGIP